LPDWTTDALDTLERAVGAVRDRTVLPARRVARAIVFGVLATFFALPALVVATIALFRGLVVALEDAWLAYLVLGGIFIAAGALCFRLRLPAKDRHA
jgi:hypothetical protein